MPESKAITFKDEQRPNGGVLRSYYCGRVHVSTVRIDAGASPSQKRAAQDDERRFLGTRAAPAVEARPAPAVASEPAQVAKSPQRIAREELYQACIERGGPDFSDADALAAELGIEAATDLVRKHGPEAPMQALSEHVWRTWGGGAGT